MSRVSFGTVLLCAICILPGGCTIQKSITGEPILYGINPVTGELLDRDVVPDVPAGGTPVGIVPHKEQMIAIVVNTIFLRDVMEAEFANPHVVVYAEVHDDGTDNPQTALTRVLLNSQNQPGAVVLPMADRVLYGPVPFKGHSIRIKFYIVELDKKDKERASRIIQAAGAVAGAASPQYAPAIDIGVKVAEALNELNEDDFELRFDLTLGTAQPVGKYDIGHSLLRDSKPPEPVQRQGKTVTMTTGLRTGQYVVIKRELRERYEARLFDVKIVESAKPKWNPSILAFDHAQEGFNRPHGEAWTWSQESKHTALLRFQGGYLYWNMARANFMDLKDEKPRKVTLIGGSGDGQQFTIRPGIRHRFEDQTYVAFTVTSDLTEPVADGGRADSDRDVLALKSILDKSTADDATSPLLSRIDDIAASVKAKIQLQKLSQDSARHAKDDPAFRASPEYVIDWSSAIIDTDAVTPAGPLNATAVATNTKLLDVLRHLVVDLPRVDPGDKAKLAIVKALAPADLEPFAPAGGAGRGRFQLSAAGRTKFGLPARTAPAATPPPPPPPPPAP